MVDIIQEPLDSRVSSLKPKASITGEHYKNNGHDLINHWQLANSVPVARAKQISQIERYCSRYGSKDDALVEAKKIQDYANRLVAWEESLIAAESK